MKFIKDINKYYKQEVNLIDNIPLFIKSNNGLNIYITKYWYKNGKLHRGNDKPAIEFPDGSKSWYKNGKRHRENDKPAIEYLSGTKVWYINGKRHRENDKPAIEWSNGRKEWWINDNFIKLNFGKSLTKRKD